MGFEVDLCQRAAIAWNFALYAALQRWGVPAAATERLAMVLPLLELALLVGGLAAMASEIDRRWTVRRPGSAAARALGAVQVLAALGVLRLLYWIYLHPSREITGVAARWDYLVAAVLAGLVLRRAPLSLRIWLLVGLSWVVLEQYVGQTPVRVVAGACLLGFVATRWPLANRPGVRVAVHGTLMTAVFLWLWWQRAPAAWTALLGWGFYSFVLFRHVSFVVEHARGAPSTLGGYLCYLLFFPNCMGAMEVYDEFWERNLRADGEREFARAAGMLIAGNALLWVSLMIPVDETRVTTSTGFGAMWGHALILYGRAACGAMGIWSIIEGGALFLGVRLRPNFRGVLTATNPSQFWRSWRGTMTNWLIRYVYIPLGGNRRHQVLNIVAVFVVSTVWHCLGVPFLRPATWTAFELLPIVTWGAVNCVGIVTHARFRRRWPAATTGPVGRALRPLKWPGTMVFASLTVLLLGFSLGGIERFAHVVRTLAGLEGW